jgi:hypothetical protein
LSFLGKTVERGKTMEREQEDEVASYEDVREIQITKNSEKLQSFGIRTLFRQLSTMQQPKPVQKRRKKVM